MKWETHRAIARLAGEGILPREHLERLVNEVVSPDLHRKEDEPHHAKNAWEKAVSRAINARNWFLKGDMSWCAAMLAEAMHFVHDACASWAYRAFTGRRAAEADEEIARVDVGSLGLGDHVVDEFEPRLRDEFRRRKGVEPETRPGSYLEFCCKRLLDELSREHYRDAEAAVRYAYVLSRIFARMVWADPVITDEMIRDARRKRVRKVVVGILTLLAIYGSERWIFGRAPMWEFILNPIMALLHRDVSMLELSGYALLTAISVSALALLTCFGLTKLFWWFASLGVPTVACMILRWMGRIPAYIPYLLISMTAIAATLCICDAAGNLAAGPPEGVLWNKVEMKAPSLRLRVSDEELKRLFEARTDVEAHRRAGERLLRRMKIRRVAAWILSSAMLSLIPLGILFNVNIAEVLVDEIIFAYLPWLDSILWPICGLFLIFGLVAMFTSMLGIAVWAAFIVLYAVIPIASALMGVATWGNFTVLPWFRDHYAVTMILAWALATFISPERYGPKQAVERVLVSSRWGIERGLERIEVLLRAERAKRGRG